MMRGHCFICAWCCPRRLLGSPVPLGMLIKRQFCDPTQHADAGRATVTEEHCRTHRCDKTVTANYLCVTPCIQMNCLLPLPLVCPLSCHACHAQLCW